MMTLLAAAIPILFFGGLAASAWYVDTRLRALFGITAQRRSTLVAVAVIVGIVATMGVTATSANAAAGILYVIAGYVFTFYLYLLFALLCLHGVQRITNMRKAFSGTGAVLLALAATAAGVMQANDFVVNETAIKLAGLNREVRVVQISDVHLGHHRGLDYLARIVEETNRRKPDLVLITGDLVDSNVALQPDVLRPLSSLSAPTYFVGGNHENYIDLPRALDLIARSGVKILHNEMVEAHGLQLVGLDYMKADQQTFDMHPSADIRTIQSTLSRLQLRKELPSVLMHHSPVGVQYAHSAGIDLMLSGHTHAGQLFPATLIAALIFPFNHGLYQQGKTQIYVSQGAGTFLQRIRLGSANEIDLLHLLPGGDS